MHGRVNARDDRVRARRLASSSAVSGETRTDNLVQLQCHAHGRCNRLALGVH